MNNLPAPPRISSRREHTSQALELERTLRMRGDEFAGSWTLATIADLFDDAGVKLGDPSTASEVSGQRRGLATQYISTLNLNHPADLAKLVEVVNHFLFDMLHGSEAEPLAVQFTERLIEQIRRDGFNRSMRSPGSIAMRRF